MNKISKIIFMSMLLLTTAVSVSAMNISLEKQKPRQTINDNSKNNQTYYCLYVIPCNIDFSGRVKYEIWNLGDGTCVNATMDSEWFGNTCKRGIWGEKSKLFVENVAPGEIKYFYTQEPIFKKYYWSFPYRYREFGTYKFPLFSHKPMTGSYINELTCGDSWVRYIVGVCPTSLVCSSG